MKLLHTSDWHLGKTLYGRRCTVEHAEFLAWLLREIQNQNIDCLLIAGDIFDSTTPSNTSQSQYYSFLYDVSKTCCRHVVIIGGNHDSPSLLNAARQLLKHLNVYIVGSSTGVPDDEIIVLRNEQGAVEGIVCAVPYLRDRDVRTSDIYESIDDKAARLVQGIQAHYREVVEKARRIRGELGGNIPLIAMGHLFTAGGKVADNDEVRDLYVGALAHIHGSCFPDTIDYLALGHLHAAQKVNGRENMCYSGSPLQFSFGKDNRDKSVNVVTLDQEITVDMMPVPPFLRLESLAGSMTEILSRIGQLASDKEPVLLEVRYAGHDIALLREKIEERLHGTRLELLRLVNSRLTNLALRQDIDTVELADLDEAEVFQRCLDLHEIDAGERRDLEFCFARVLEALAEDHEEENSQ